MIDIPFSNGNTYQIKNSWEELNAREYQLILNEILLFMSGGITLAQFRIKVFLHLSGLKPMLRLKTNQADQQAENIYRMARLITFPLRIEYENSKALEKMEKHTSELLYRYLPDEIEQTPETRWAEKAKKAIKPDLIFSRNLIPTIGRRRHTYKGYTFDVDDNILTTSLTTSQFIDAQVIAGEIEKTGKESLLNLLVAILYTDGFYKSQHSVSLAKTLGWLDLETKKAIFINFNAIQTYLCTRTKYSILFNAPSPERAAVEGKPKHNLGLGTAAHSLIKSGYGDIENSNLVKFFEIMYSELVGNVVGLHKQGKTIDEISEATGLSYSKINQII